MTAPRPTWEPISLRCDACRCSWEDWQPSNVPVATWAAHVGTYHCPACFQSGRAILIRPRSEAGT